MKGSIDKYTTKGSSKPHWRYRIYLGKNEHGKKLWGARAGFEKQAEALDAMRKRIDELRASTDSAAAPPTQNKTLGGWLEVWFDTYALDCCEPKTIERYRELADYLLKESDGMPSVLAKIPLPDLKHTHLEPAFFALLKAKAKRREHISANSVRHVAAVVRGALNKAFKLELITVNPMLRVELPKVPKKDVRSLIPAEIQNLRLICRGDWTFALIELAMASGARRGELLALQWADLDWISGSVTFSKSLEQTKAGLRVKCTKNGKTRSCRLPQSAAVALQFLREQQKEHRSMFAGSYKNLDLVFCQTDGNYYEPDLVSQTIVRRIQKAGIKGASLHTLRHTHASNLLSRGVSLPAVSARLGHSDPNVTARIYSHALPADDQRATDIWDAVIDGPIQ